MRLRSCDRAQPGHALRRYPEGHLAREVGRGVFRGQRNGAHAAMPWPLATAEGVAASPVSSQFREGSAVLSGQGSEGLTRPPV